MFALEAAVVIPMVNVLCVFALAASGADGWRVGSVAAAVGWESAGVGVAGLLVNLSGLDLAEVESEVGGW